MSTIVSWICLWIAGLGTGLWIAGLVAHSSSPAKKEQSMWLYCAAFLVPLICAALFMLLAAVINELMTQVSLEDTAKLIIEALGLVQ